jgi:hypothetical protein
MRPGRLKVRISTFMICAIPRPLGTGRLEDPQHGGPLCHVLYREPVSGGVQDREQAGRGCDPAVTFSAQPGRRNGQRLSTGLPCIGLPGERWRREAVHCFTVTRNPPGKGGLCGSELGQNVFRLQRGSPRASCPASRRPPDRDPGRRHGCDLGGVRYGSFSAQSYRRAGHAPWSPGRRS